MTAIGGNSGYVKVAIAPTDQKIIVVGDGAWVERERSRSGLAHYNTDGSLDSTFGSNGTTMGVVFHPDSGNLHSVAVEGDGKIVVEANADTNLVLAGYTADGTLDSSFGSGGTVTTDLWGSWAIGDMALQPDGEILVASAVIPGDYCQFGLERYNTNGSLDGSFGTDGLVTTAFGEQIYAWATGLQSDGRIIVAGDALNDNGEYGIALAGYTTGQAVTVENVAPTLTLSGDASVNEGSMYTLHLSSSDPGDDTIASWTIDWGDGSNPQTYTAEEVGNLNGVVTHVYADGPNTYVITASATDEDGTYNVTSQVDTSFGDNGLTTTALPEGMWVCSSATQADGKTLVLSSDGNGNYVLTRLGLDGQVDTTFGTDGSVATDLCGMGAGPIAIQSDGAIVIAGTVQGENDCDCALVRFEQHGALDEDFGNDGVAMAGFDAAGPSRRRCGDPSRREDPCWR